MRNRPRRFCWVQIPRRTFKENGSKCLHHFLSDHTLKSIGLEATVTDSHPIFSCEETSSQASMEGSTGQPCKGFFLSPLSFAPGQFPHTHGIHSSRPGVIQNRTWFLDSRIALQIFSICEEKMCLIGERGKAGEEDKCEKLSGLTYNRLLVRPL